MLERNAAITIGTGGLVSNGISSVTIGGSSAITRMGLSRQLQVA